MSKSNVYSRILAQEMSRNLIRPWRALSWDPSRFYILWFMKRTLAAVLLFTISACASASQVKTRGRADAPVLIEIYSDYQCPICKTLYETTLQPLVANYLRARSGLLRVRRASRG